MYVEVYWSPLLFNQAPQVENLNFLEFKGPKVQVCNNHRFIEKKKIPSLKLWKHFLLFISTATVSNSLISQFSQRMLHSNLKRTCLNLKILKLRFCILGITYFAHRSHMIKSKLRVPVSFITALLLFHNQFTDLIQDP